MAPMAKAACGAPGELTTPLQLSLVFTRLRLNGKPAMNAAEANLTLGPHLSAVRFGKAAR